MANPNDLPPPGISGQTLAADPWPLASVIATRLGVLSETSSVGVRRGGFLSTVTNRYTDGALARLDAMSRWADNIGGSDAPFLASGLDSGAGLVRTAPEFAEGFSALLGAASDMDVLQLLATPVAPPEEGIAAPDSAPRRGSLFGRSRQRPAAARSGRAPSFGGAAGPTAQVAADSRGGIATAGASSPNNRLSGAGTRPFGADDRPLLGVTAAAGRGGAHGRRALALDGALVSRGLPALGAALGFVAERLGVSTVAASSSRAVRGVAPRTGGGSPDGASQPTRTLSSALGAIRRAATPGSSNEPSMVRLADLTPMAFSARALVAALGGQRGASGAQRVVGASIGAPGSAASGLRGGAAAPTSEAFGGRSSAFGGALLTQGWLGVAERFGALGGAAVSYDAAVAPSALHRSVLAGRYGAETFRAANPADLPAGWELDADLISAAASPSVSVASGGSAVSELPLSARSRMGRGVAAVGGTQRITADTINAQRRRNAHSAASTLSSAARSAIGAPPEARPSAGAPAVAQGSPAAQPRSGAVARFATILQGLQRAVSTPPRAQAGAAAGSIPTTAPIPALGAAGTAAAPTSRGASWASATPLSAASPLARLLAQQGAAQRETLSGGRSRLAAGGAQVPSAVGVLGAQTQSDIGSGLLNRGATAAAGAPSSLVASQGSEGAASTLGARRVAFLADSVVSRWAQSLADTVRNALVSASALGIPEAAAATAVTERLNAAGRRAGIGLIAAESVRALSPGAGLGSPRDLGGFGLDADLVALAAASSVADEAGLQATSSSVSVGSAALRSSAGVGLHAGGQVARAPRLAAGVPSAGERFISWIAPAAASAQQLAREVSLGAWPASAEGLQEGRGASGPGRSGEQGGTPLGFAAHLEGRAERFSSALSRRMGDAPTSSGRDTASPVGLGGWLLDAALIEPGAAAADDAGAVALGTAYAAGSARSASRANQARPQTGSRGSLARLAFADLQVLRAGRDLRTSAHTPSAARAALRGVAAQGAAVAPSGIRGDFSGAVASGVSRAGAEGQGRGRGSAPGSTGRRGAAPGSVANGESPALLSLASQSEGAVEQPGLAAFGGVQRAGARSMRGGRAQAQIGRSLALDGRLGAPVSRAAGLPAGFVSSASGALPALAPVGGFQGILAGLLAGQPFDAAQGDSAPEPRVAVGGVPSAAWQWSPAGDLVVGSGAGVGSSVDAGFSEPASMASGRLSRRSGGAGRAAVSSLGFAAAAAGKWDQPSVAMSPSGRSPVSASRPLPPLGARLDAHAAGRPGMQRSGGARAGMFVGGEGTELVSLQSSGLTDASRGGNESLRGQGSPRPGIGGRTSRGSRQGVAPAAAKGVSDLSAVARAERSSPLLTSLSQRWGEGPANELAAVSQFQSGGVLQSSHVIGGSTALRDLVSLVQTVGAAGAIDKLQLGHSSHFAFGVLSRAESGLRAALGGRGGAGPALTATARRAAGAESGALVELGASDVADMAAAHVERRAPASAARIRRQKATGRGASADSAARADAAPRSLVAGGANATGDDLSLVVPHQPTLEHGKAGTNLGALARATAMGGAARATPDAMPLIAPVTVAVAQSARLSKQGEEPDNPENVDPKSDENTRSGPLGKPKIDLDKLALEITNRINLQFKVELERRGVWRT